MMEKSDKGKERGGNKSLYKGGWTKGVLARRRRKRNKCLYELGGEEQGWQGCESWQSDESWQGGESWQCGEAPVAAEAPEVSTLYALEAVEDTAESAGLDSDLGATVVDIEWG